MNRKLVWYKVLNSKNELPEGRVRTVTAGRRDLCLTHFEGRFSALENKCPHQGGPLGEGSIEKGMLRCPWHGYDYHPCTGQPPAGFEDCLETFPVKEENDEIYVGLEEESPHHTTLSDVMVETMVNWGVTTVFGMVGHSNLGFADALRRQEEKGCLEFFGVRHEGAASFAASAYGKLTAKPAACFSIAGPGATNMYTGLWDAKVDRAPLLALTGQVATQVVGTGNFQELDLVQAFSTVAVFNQRVQKDSKHAELMGLAIKHALIKRDVAHLTFPDEIQEAAAPPTSQVGSPHSRMADFHITPSHESLERAKLAIAQAQRPVIIMGHGARMHRAHVIALAEQLNAPVLTTFKGKGLISDRHPLGCGVIGRSGTPVASWCMNESDLLIVVGASFSKHTGISTYKPIIQIDSDPLAIAKFHKIDFPLWGEISRTVELLAAGVSTKSETRQDQRSEVSERWKIWREEKRKRLNEKSEKGVSSIRIFESMNETAPKNAVMCVDVGNNAYSFGRYFECAEHDFLMSGYLGSIGFAVPAALGAWAAVKNTRPIIAVAGDGGVSQYLSEITTFVKYNIPVKVIILNNSELGKISKEQRSGNFDVWSTSLVNPDFALFAKSCGAWGKQIRRDEEVHAALQELFAAQGPAVLEIITDAALI